MRLTDNLHPSIPSSAFHCDASNSHTRKNLQRTSQCETNDTVLKQKWLEQEASTTFLLHLPLLKRRVPESFFFFFHHAFESQFSTWSCHSPCLPRSPVSTALSLILAAIRFLRLSLILCHSLLARSLLRLRLSSSPSQLQKSFFALLSSASGLSVRDHRDAAVVSGTRTATALLKTISEKLHKQLYSQST